MRKGFHDQDEAQHQGLPVAGYVPQSDERIKLVNENKVLEELILRQIDQIQRLASGVEHRWVSIAKINLEQGFMALNRSIFRPTRIKLPEDTDVA